VDFLEQWNSDFGLKVSDYLPKSSDKSCKYPKSIVFTYLLVQSRKEFFDDIAAISYKL